MSDWEIFAYILIWIVIATAVVIVGGFVTDSISAATERKRRKKFRNNYVRFR